MKKTDIAMLVLIAGVSVVISSFVLNNILGDPGEKTRNVEITDEIQAGFTEPNKEIFNKDAISPTVPIMIGEDGAAPMSDAQRAAN